MRRTDGTAAGSADAGRTPRRCGNSPTREADRWHPTRPSFSSGGSQATIRRKGRHAQRSQPHPNRPAHPDTHPFQSLCAAPAPPFTARGHTDAPARCMLQHAPAHTNSHQNTVSTARAPRSMYPASSAQTKPPYTASAAPSTARGHTDAPAWRMLQHAPAHTNSHQPRLQHRLHSTCPTPMLPEKPAIRARHKLRHRSRHAPQPIRPGHLPPEHIANSGSDWAPHHAQLSRSTTSPPQDPAIRTQKKVRPFDLTLKRRLPTLPRENRSTIGVSELNFSVRNGKRWNLTAITT